MTCENAHANNGCHEDNRQIDEHGYLKMEGESTSPKDEEYYEILDDERDPDYNYVTTMDAEQMKKISNGNNIMCSPVTANLQQYATDKHMFNNNCEKPDGVPDHSHEEKTRIIHIVIYLVVGILCVMISVTVTSIYFTLIRDHGE